MSKGRKVFKLIPDPLDERRLRRSEWVANWWTFGGAIISALAASVTIAGLYVAYQTGRDAQQSQTAALAREAQTDARAQYADYLKLAIDHPALASGEAFRSPDPSTRSAYEWFVAYLLFSCERIIEAYPDDEVWLDVCRDQIRIHAEYLRAANTGEDLKGYSEDMQRLVESVISEQGQ